MESCKHGTFTIGLLVACPRSIIFVGSNVADDLSPNDGPFEFQRTPFDEKDYKIVQSTMMGVWVIGFHYSSHAVSHWYNQ